MTDICHLPYPEGCVRATFLERRKRFTVRALDRHGRELLAHTNNTGSMLGLLHPGAAAWLSPAANPARKLPWTLECLDFHGGWVGINTLTPNRMLRRAWQTGAVAELAAYDQYKAEATVGQSRLDARLNGPDGELWVECKNVTLVEDETAIFPDAATERGRKHLRELTALARRDIRVALFFLIQRSDARCFGPADMIDPEYAELLFQAMDAGVEVWPHLAQVDETGITLGARLPVSHFLEDD